MLNYGAATAELEACVGSVVASPAGVVREIILADNRAASNGSAPDEVAAAFGAIVRVVRLDRNYGFAGGINRALRHCSGEFVYLLNNDATVAADAIGRALAALETADDPSILGVASKMLITGELDGTDAVIDSVGMAVNPAAEAFNIGLGQPDLGQYDHEPATFGPCFGAALLRRSAFRADQVGPLLDRYFLYYEDVEWNWRANLLGYSFITAPYSIVHHRMSSSTRHLDYGFKFRLIERNLLLTAAELCAPRRALSIWFRRGAGLARGAVTGRHYPVASVRALAGALAGLPAALLRRRRLQRRRMATDENLFRFADAERTFYDAVQYRPIERDAAREFAVARRPRR